jgi:hypothetical protein
VTDTLLAPCPSCARHVRLTDDACPFCAAALPRAFREQTAPVSPAKRLNRAALYALRMGAVSMAAVACGGSVLAGGGDGGESDSATIQDGANGGGSSGGSSGGREDAPYTVAPDGGFVPYDTGTTEQPLDASIDTKPADAEPDHVLYPAPPYGSPAPI